MVSAGFQILGIVLAIIGWIGAIIACAFPQWKVTALVGQSSISPETTWQGIWTECVVRNSGVMSCEGYDSILGLDSNLQAARALIIISILIGMVAILLGIVGGKWTNCVEDESAKAKVCIAAGAMFVIAGILCLIPISWTTNSVIRDFHNPSLVNTQKLEMGASLFIGWGAAALLILGGGLLCANCPPKEKFSAKYSAPRSTSPVKDYV